MSNKKTVPVIYVILMDIDGNVYLQLKLHHMRVLHGLNIYNHIQLSSFTTRTQTKSRRAPPRFCHYDRQKL